MPILNNILNKITGGSGRKYWSGAESQKIYLVDTNLFFECKVLEELPWSELAGDDIVILVTQYVLDEIEKHKKGREQSRTKKRAIKISSRLRPLILGQETELTVQHENPRVSLRLETLVKPSRKIEKTLDLSIMDNKIVGCLDTLQSSGLDVSLLSHDGNAVSTAKSLSFPATLIPDHWLLELQDDDETREIKQLKKEVEFLKRQEPEVTIVCIDDQGTRAKRIQFSQNIYLPLGESKVCQLIDELKIKVPIVTDFGSEQTTPKPTFPKFLGQSRFVAFEAASSKEISEYRDKKYPDWLLDCQEYLNDFHSKIHWKEEPARIHFDIENVGTRPAKSTLVEFEAKGDLKIMPPPRKGSQDEEDRIEGQSDKELALPPYPRPPRGRWKEKSRGSLSTYERLMGVIPEHYARISNVPINLPSFTSPQPHDPDGFYWKDGRPMTPQQYCSLTCDNWRHAIGTQSFSFEIYPERGKKNVKGALACTIHADNKSKPSNLTVPIEFVTIEIDVYPIAEKLIHELIVT